MIRYRLDDLGWYHFEWLVQLLLKAHLGLGVESWGGSGDHGRDAYFDGRLEFPARGVCEGGPFIFQAKFVDGANGAGARPRERTLAAIAKEAERIRGRRHNFKWTDPKWYVFLTNAPLSPEIRKEVAIRLEKVVPGVRTHSLGANDICDLLDLDKDHRVVRAFPQLMSLRDLNALLSEAVSKDVLQRSHYAVECARDVIPVFVPTSAYVKTWEILRKHHFVALDGPPEVGKSAIAWVIAISQLSRGWQAIECNDPRDFFQSYLPESPQIFIADDAFGRVSYDPTRVRKWEINLDRMHRALNQSHWLIWTSRRHILEMARKEMDLQGQTGHFPQPGELVVDATQLSRREKALMLYRHARAAGLAAKARTFLREFAPMVVDDSNFTPERIRRFVSDQLPEMPEVPPSLREIAHAMSPGEEKPASMIVVKEWSRRRELVEHAIRNAIRNSTDRMKKAFRALPTPHKWLLIAMLEAGDRVSVENLKDLYDKDCPDRSQEPFTDVMEDLTESFLKDMSRTKGAVSVDWIHPSCKDLVIEESARQPQLRNAFLRVMSLSGIKIAISTSGGAEGTRVFPFLTSKQSWELLQVRCSSVIAAGSDDETADLLRVVAEAHRKAPNAQSRSRVERTLDVACSEARHMWDRGAMPLSTEGLAAYCEAGSRLPKMPDLPNIESSWREKDGKVRERVHKCENIFDVDIDAVCDWVRFATMVINVNPTIIQGGNVTANFGNETAKLTYIAEKEIEDTASYDEGGSGDIFGDEADSLRWHAELVITLAKTLEYLAVMLPGDREKLQTLMVDLKERASRLVDRANRMEATPDDEGEDSYAGRSESFDVRRLFSDL